MTHPVSHLCFHCSNRNSVLILFSYSQCTVYCFRNIAITYSINRQRGSTSTYIHEVNESCRTAGSSLEHGGVVEMVVHLLRNDEIFISVSKSHIEYLATEPGSHMLGLFEL